MFQSFTGSSRRPRQVNLSGRATNPFAAFPGNSPTRSTPHAANPETAVAIAQRERLLRQQERERQSASRIIQRVWRGHRSRTATYKEWRSEWDTFEWERAKHALSSTEGNDRAPTTDFERLQCLLRCSPPPYANAEQCLDQLRLFVQFVGSPRSSEDILRLLYFCNVFEKTFHALPTIATEGEWTELLKRLAIAVLYSLSSASNTPIHGEAVLPLLRTVVFLVDLIPKKMAMNANTYYRAMAHLTKNLVSLGDNLAPEHVVNAAIALLRPITSETMAAYEAFAISYLSVPDLAAYLGGLDGLAQQINYKVLASAVGSCMHPAKASSRALQDIKARSWLLAYLIYFHRHALGGQANIGAPDLGFLAVVSELLNSTAAYLTRCLETEESNETDPSNGPSLHPFVKDQVTSLVNQSSITGLLSRIRPSHLTQTDFSNSESDSSTEAKILATYALNLLRVFPRRGDDIRMWLYLGSAPSGDQASGQPGAKIPAIKYFWQASRSSRVFDIITNEPTKVLSLLELPQLGSRIEISQEDRDQEWTIILLFFELYTFLLKVMDDEEFFSSASPFTASSNTKSSWTKESALPLEDVKAMTVFLKNLAFTLYWNFAALSDKGPVPSSTGDLKSYFNTASQVPEQMERFNETQAKEQPNDLPGVTGIPLDYFKGLVTGLLRMLHERE